MLFRYTDKRIGYYKKENILFGLIVLVSCKDLTLLMHSSTFLISPTIFSVVSL